MKCPECGGVGRIHYGEEWCSACNGTGEIRQTNEEGFCNLISNPRATPLVIVSYQDGVFIVRCMDTNTGVICLTPDTVADVVKEVCKKCLQKKSSS